MRGEGVGKVTESEGNLRSLWGKGEGIRMKR